MRRVYIASATRSSGFFSQVLRIVLFLGLLVVGAMLSVVALAVVLVAGLGLWAFVWWKTREIRQTLRQAKQASENTATSRADENVAHQNAGHSGVVIEGEVIRRSE